MVQAVILSPLYSKVEAVILIPLKRAMVILSPLYSIIEEKPYLMILHDAV